MIQHPASSRPVTNYLDVAIPTSRTVEDMDYGAGQPSDAELERAVQEILHDADLNTVTKKSVRQRLESVFGMDLTSRKATINAAIDRVILSQS